MATVFAFSIAGMGCLLVPDLRSAVSFFVLIWLCFLVADRWPVVLVFVFVSPWRRDCSLSFLDVAALSDSSRLRWRAFSLLFFGRDCVRLFATKSSRSSAGLHIHLGWLVLSWTPLLRWFIPPRCFGTGIGVPSHHIVVPLFAPHSRLAPVGVQTHRSDGLTTFSVGG